MTSSVVPKHQSTQTIKIVLFQLVLPERRGILNRNECTKNNLRHCGR